jgi:DNA modification methylase
MIDLRLGDCLEVMPSIANKSVDMILCDLPYGTTACKWDMIIPFEPLWEQYKRIIKDNGAIVLTASQPFTSALVMSNADNFSHQWIWIKEQGANPLLANKQPMKNFEDVLVFNKSQYDEFFTDERRIYFKQVLDFIGKNKREIIQETNQGLDHCFRCESLQFGIPTIRNYKLLISLYGIDKMEGFLDYNRIADVPRTYNPQKTKGKAYTAKAGKIGKVFGGKLEGFITENKGDRFPTSIIKIPRDKTKLHPTQKPVALFEYLIKTYTNEGDLVLDNCTGSGTTGVACKNLNRNCILIEKDEEYFKIAERRINNTTENLL